MDSNGWFTNHEWRGVFETAINQLSNLRKNDKISIEDKKILFCKFASALEPSVRQAAAWKIKDKVFHASAMCKSLKEYWIDMQNDLFDEDKCHIDDGITWTYKYVDTNEFQKYLDRCFERFIRNVPVQNELNQTAENTRKSALEILEWLKRAA
jgi:hypothetical protein